MLIHHAHRTNRSAQVPPQQRRRSALILNCRVLAIRKQVLLDRELSRQFGSDRVFQASRSIPVGSDFKEWLMSYPRRSSVLLAIIGPDWSAAGDGSGRRRLLDEKDWVRREIAEAFTLGIPVIPVLVNDAARLAGRTGFGRGNGRIHQALAPNPHRSIIRT